MMTKPRIPAVAHLDDERLRDRRGSESSRQIHQLARQAIRRAAKRATAPTHCAATYGTTSDARNRPTDQNPIVTAGLTCAPPRCPLDATIERDGEPERERHPSARTRACAPRPSPRQARSRRARTCRAARRHIDARASASCVYASRTSDCPARSQIRRELVRQRALENRARPRVDVVLDADETRRRRRSRRSSDDHVAGAPIAILRPADAAGVHEVHAVHHAMPRLVRVAERNDVAVARADSLPHLREKIVGAIFGDVDGVERLIAVNKRQRRPGRGARRADE